VGLPSGPRGPEVSAHFQGAPTTKAYMRPVPWSMDVNRSTMAFSGASPALASANRALISGTTAAMYSNMKILSGYRVGVDTRASSRDLRAGRAMCILVMASRTRAPTVPTMSFRASCSWNTNTRLQKG